MSDEGMFHDMSMSNEIYEWTIEYDDFVVNLTVLCVAL